MPRIQLGLALLLILSSLNDVLCLDVYLGCFTADAQVFRGLPTRLWSVAPMTVGVCSALASARGQAAYGLVNNQCWIGECRKYMPLRCSSPEFTERVHRAC